MKETFKIKITVLDVRVGWKDQGGWCYKDKIGGKSKHFENVKSPLFFDPGLIFFGANILGWERASAIKSWAFRLFVLVSSMVPEKSGVGVCPVFLQWCRKMWGGGNFEGGKFWKEIRRQTPKLCGHNWGSTKKKDKKYELSPKTMFNN